MKDGIPLGRRPDLVGGGLVRSAGGWAEVRAMRQRTDRMAADPRILGNGEFVEQMLQEARPRLLAETQRRRSAREAAAALHAACQREGCTPEELGAGSRRGHIPLLRAKLARHLVTKLGLSLAETARHLGVSTSAISRIVRKSEER